MCGEAKNGVTGKNKRLKGAGRAKCGISEMCVVLVGNKKTGTRKRATVWAMCGEASNGVTEKN